MSYKIVFTKKAYKDMQNIKAAKLNRQVKELLEIIEKDPFQYPPEFEALKYNWAGYYSRRINRQHRLVYRVQGEKIIIISVWTHYENI